MPPDDDPYLLPNGTLRNKLGLTSAKALAAAEDRITAARATLLVANLPKAPFNYETLKIIHKRLFQDVYTWAGEARTTSLAKRDFAHPGSPVQSFAAPSTIQPRAEALFSRLADKGFLQGTSPAQFATEASQAFVELNAIHFAREGNGRTQRLLLTALAAHAGHKLAFDIITRERMVAVSVDGHKGDPSGVRRMFEEILDPRQVDAMRTALKFLATSGRVTWNDIYVATTRAGQVYDGALVGRSGGDFMLRGTSGAGDARILIGDGADLPNGASTGDRITVKATRFGPAPTARFDPFGDHETRGYLRNFAVEKDPAIIRRLEHNAFAGNVLPALSALSAAPQIGYDEVLATHKRLFGSVYPWAGQDRAAVAPDIAIAKAGIADLFAHPADVRRAAEYGLDMARDPASMRRRPGEVFGALAYAHPFLEGNGRTVMTVHADLARRAGFHVDWQGIGKREFLEALTEELRNPGKRLDQLIAPHVRPGPMSTIDAAVTLATKLAPQGGGASPSP